MPHPPLGNPAAIPPKLQRRLDRNTRHPRSPNHGDRWIQTIEESATVVLGGGLINGRPNAGMGAPAKVRYRVTARPKWDNRLKLSPCRHIMYGLSFRSQKSGR